MSLRKVLPFVLLLGATSTARAEKVLMYGIQRGCQTDADLTKLVTQQLTSSAYSVVPLAPAAPLSQPKAAGEQVAQACPGLPGRMLGGFVDETQGQKRARLWLVELDSQRVAVLDDYCTDCNLAERLALSAVRLADKPRFGGQPSPTPSYCQTEVAAASTPVRSNKLAVVVYGDPKPRAAVFSAVRGAVQGTGRDVAQTHAEAKSLGPSDLRKMLREPSGQVLGIELTPEGASMWVFDGATERTQPMNVQCQACEREDLARKVSLAALAVLDTCFDAQCEGAARGTPLRPPAEACLPFKEPQCGGTDPTTAGDRGGTTGGLDPGTAKLIKGLTWGAVGATAATGIALIALSGTAAGTYTDPAGFTIARNLDGPAFAMFGTSAALLAITIPITVAVNRAAVAKPQRTAPGGKSSLLACPN